MRIFGREIAWPWAKRDKALPALSPVSPRSLWTVVYESFSGAWQQNVKVNRDEVLTYFAVFACITLIAGDIGKLRLRLVEKRNGIWDEVDAQSPFWPVLKKPNRYQTRQKFIEQWLTSKLIHGNAYILKERDRRGVVRALYVLDPTRVTALVAPDGAVYYQLQDDDLAQVPTGLPAVPASEIIHDTMVCLHHPLIGVSPLYACGIAATHGLNIQSNSTKFFASGSRPGGVITAPARIEDDVAKRIKEHWDSNYSGENVGKVAVLGDGLKYEQMSVNAVDAQLIEQLKLSAEFVCSAFHVPPWKIGIGTMPTYQSVEILNQIYYSDCLQALIESIEAHLDEGLGLANAEGKLLGTEFDLDDLMRMDTKSKVEAVEKAIGSGGMAPNEARRRWLDLPPVKGGETPYLQQQNFSLGALADRDSTNPLSTPQPAAAPPASSDEDDEPDEERVEERAAFYLVGLQKELANAEAR